MQTVKLPIREGIIAQKSKEPENLHEQTEWKMPAPPAKL
jgi:hypothetical protein